MATRQQMSSSRTMPQLNYTEADIQEQYLSRPSVRLNQAQQNNSRPPAGHGQSASDQHQSVRWRRSQQLAKFDDNVSDEQHAHQGTGDAGPVSSERVGGFGRELGNDHDELNDGRRRAGRSKQPDDESCPKRKRRSRSASRLLSACLHIPAQLASSISSHHHHHHHNQQQQQQPTATSSQRTFKASSILSHFRIGHHHHNHPATRDSNDENDQFHQNDHELDYSKQRPLSSSRTLGDLQLTPSTGLDSPASQTGGGRLKHVSFGENSQQQPTPTTSTIVNVTRQENVINSSIQNPQPPHNTLALASGGGSLASARKQTHPDGGGLLTSQNLQKQQQQQQQQKAIASNLPVGPTSQGRLCQPAPISRQPTSSTSLTGSNQVAGFSHQQHHHLHHQHQQQLQHVARQQQQQQPTQSTIYKRLPNIPMRTQATQTEITAYHLMNSPSGLSSVGSCSLAGTMTRQQLRSGPAHDSATEPQELCSSAVEEVPPGLHGANMQTNADTPTNSQASATTTLAPATSASSNQTQPVISPQKSISNSSSDRQDQSQNDSASLLAHEQNEPAQLMIGLASKETRGQTEAGNGDENEDEDEDELEISPSVQASLLQSSSNSSSSVSLVGHDSALADTLKCDLRIGATAPVVRQDSESKRGRPTASEHASGTQSQRASIIEPTATSSVAAAAAAATMQAMSRRSGTTNELTADELTSCERPSEIEPPTRFKDGQVTSETLTSVDSQRQREQQPLERPPSSVLYSKSAVDDNEHNEVEPLEEDEDEARTSPPSLSEASSQTDASMASSHMLDRIGRALERQAVKAAKRRSSATDSSSQQQQHQRQVQLQSRRRQISIDTGTTPLPPPPPTPTPMQLASLQSDDTLSRASGATSARMRPLASLEQQAPKRMGNKVAEKRRRDSVEQQLGQEVDGGFGPTSETPPTRQTNCHNLVQALEKFENSSADVTIPKTLYSGADSSTASISSETIRQADERGPEWRPAQDLPAEVLQRRDQFLTSSQALSDEFDAELGRSGPRAKQEQHSQPPKEADGFCSRRLVGAQTESTLSGTNELDDEIQVDLMQVLDSDELLEAAASELAGRRRQQQQQQLDEQLDAEQRQLVEQHHQIQLAVSHAIVERVRKPTSTTTSTLSTRHHSYCSSDDFQTRTESQLEADELDDDVEPDCGPTTASKFAGDQDQNDDETQTSEQKQRQQSITMREASKESFSSLSSLVSDKQKDDEPTSSSSASSGQTLKSAGAGASKRGCGLSEEAEELQMGLLEAKTAPTNDSDARSVLANEAANGPNKSGPTGDQLNLGQISPTNDLNDDDDEDQLQAPTSSTETTINLMTPKATANKIRANDEQANQDEPNLGQAAQRQRSAGVSLSSSCSNSFSSSSSSRSQSGSSNGSSKRSLDQPKAGPSSEQMQQQQQQQQQPATSEGDSHEAIESAGSLIRKASSPSPPTTVSDLDQDEELSTPSFVDNYKRRLEDHVNELAESFTSNLLGECLESVEIVGGGETPSENEIGNKRDQTIEPTESSKMAQTSQLKSSTSVSSASSVSTTTSTTTSVGGSSYVCLNDGQTMRRSAAREQETGRQPTNPVAKPQLPKKPAHLAGAVQPASRQQEMELVQNHERHCDERASAVAITASSIAAAAAALHKNGQSLAGATLTMADQKLTQTEHQHEAEQALESQDTNEATTTTTTSRQTQESDRPLRVSSAEVAEALGDYSAGPLSRTNALQISPNEVEAGTQVAPTSIGHEADHNSAACEPQQRQVATQPPPQSAPSAEAELMTVPNGKQSPVELSTLSEVSDEVSLSDGQQHRNSLEHIASGGQSESCDRSDSNPRDAQCKPAALIRQLSESLDSRTSPAQSASLANWAHRHSLSEQSSSQQTQSVRPAASVQVRPTPTTALVDCPYVATVTSAARISTEKKPALVSNISSSTTTAGNGGNPLALSLGAVTGPAAGAANVTGSSTTGAASSTSSHHVVKRLSHDDTMEAIEDDVEGEEQEMKLLSELQQQLPRPPGQLSAVALANIAPPAGFCSAPHYPPLGSSRPGSSLSGPSPVSGQSIQEEDEDEELDEQAGANKQDKGDSRLASDLEADQNLAEVQRLERNSEQKVSSAEEEDDDEESSISVSKEHGVVVESSSRPAAARASRSDNKEPMKKSTIKMKRFKRSSSNSDSSSPSSSARATPVAAGSRPSTPTTSSATMSTSDDSTKTGSPVQRQRDDNEDQASEKSESQRELLIATPTSDHLEEPARQQEADSGRDVGQLAASEGRKESASAVDKSASGLDSVRSDEQAPDSIKRDSTESATHAILEHLSRHQHPAIASAMALDEPALSLELCRSIDPQQRRASWRKESETSRGTSSIQSPINHQRLTSPAAVITTQRRPIVQSAISSDAQSSAAGLQSKAGIKSFDSEMSQSQQSQEVVSTSENCDDWTSPSNSPSRTGTMKRRRRRESEGGDKKQEIVNIDVGPTQPVASATGQQVFKLDTIPLKEPELADGADQSGGEQALSGKRPPPLGELKSPITRNEGMQQQQQQSSSLDRTDMDNSICSSCSCMETSFDQTIASREPMPQISEVAPSTSNQKQPQSSQQQQQRTSIATASSSWMSQEEGTVFTENYWLSHWLYISEHEEAEIWRRAIDLDRPGSSVQAQGRRPGQDIDRNKDQSQHQSLARDDDVRGPSQQYLEAGLPEDMNETASTISERSFNTRYKSTTRKMIHRRASIEMFKRILANNLRKEKRVEISRSSVGEFGFRIHGSRPVVVSAIERGTSAETCGLQVGDLIYAINDTNILDMAHSDVVRLAHEAGSSALVLDLIPTNSFLKTARYNRLENKRYEPTVTGYLMRLSPGTAQPLLIELQERMSSSGRGASSQQRAIELNKVMRLAWRARYFVLRSDNCLYWYRSPNDMVEPLGGLNLQGFSATLTDEFSEPDYVIRLVKYGGQPHYLGSNNMCDIQTWVDTINRAATEANQSDPYMRQTLILARCKPNQIENPDCSGWLYKFSHKSGGGAHWRAAYFILKDACLYLFRNQKAELVDQASAVYYLHGYRVRSKHIEHKKHTFELIPPNRKTIKPMFLMASNEIDKRRWIAALEYSIDRWIEIN